MKKFKISLSVIAFAIAIGLSAFTVPVTKVTDAWFTITNRSLPNVAASYTYYGVTPSCSGTDELCAIKGIKNTSLPTQPTQASVNSASTASSNFTHAVTDQVDFQTP